jgi:hypothetical protein
MPTTTRPKRIAHILSSEDVMKRSGAGRIVDMITKVAAPCRTAV